MSEGMLSRPGDSVLGGTDGGLVTIGARFGAGAAVTAGDAGGDAAALLGLAPARARRPVAPFMLPPGLLTATAVGSYLDLPDQFGPPTGYFWDITSLTLSGFTAGAVAVSRNGPAVTSSGAPAAIELIAAFAAAGTQQFPQKGNPLLDGSERLVFTVTSAITGAVMISGTVIRVPACRIEEYLT